MKDKGLWRLNKTQLGVIIFLGIISIFLMGCQNTVGGVSSSVQQAAVNLRLEPGLVPAESIYTMSPSDVTDISYNLDTLYPIPCTGSCIVITADDEYILYLNGEQLNTKRKDWKIVDKYDVTLKDKDNIIAVWAADKKGGKQGLIAEVWHNGKIIARTDSSWKRIPPAKNSPEGWTELDFEEVEADGHKWLISIPYLSKDPRYFSLESATLNGDKVFNRFEANLIWCLRSKKGSECRFRKKFDLPVAERYSTEVIIEPRPSKTFWSGGRQSIRLFVANSDLPKPSICGEIRGTGEIIGIKAPLWDNLLKQPKYRVWFWKRLNTKWIECADIWDGSFGDKWGGSYLEYDIDKDGDLDFFYTPDLGYEIRVTIMYNGDYKPSDRAIKEFNEYFGEDLTNN